MKAPDPALFTPAQMGVSVLAVGVAASVSGFLIFRRRVPRAPGYCLLCVCALAALASWFRFGALHIVSIDAPAALAAEGPTRASHRLFQFHEFFHYYLGAKYFQELGYVGLYDCTVLADEEVAAEEGVPPRIRGFVRRLDDVLADKTTEEAIADCRGGARTRFTPARWSAFRSDLRELQRLVPDEAWSDVVNDKGLSPPPSFLLLGSAVANLVPIRAGGMPTYLLVTSLDLVLLAACFAALRSSFGATTAVLAAVYFGATFVASFGWLGGAVLRFTWVAAIVLSLSAARRGRHALSGALMAWAVCERVFPIGFAVGAVVPVAFASLRSPRHRAILARFGVAFAGTVVVLIAVSAAVFGVSSWSVFFARMLRDAHVHNVLHLGLEKILAYRGWVPAQDFNGHEGLARFRAWNLRIGSTLAPLRVPAIALQVAAIGGACWASRRRRSLEGSVLCGVVVMFVLFAPANYYFVILALVPAVLFRAAATAPSEPGRLREFLVLLAFNAFWMCTLLASRLSPDLIVCDLLICVALALFLVTWIATWMARSPRG